MSDTPPTAVLLHGLLRSARSMARLRRVLDEAGYETWSHAYPSNRRGIAENAADVADALARRFGDTPLVLVTHSLGGILARYIAGPLRGGLDVRGVVMLAPPNAGSRIARRLGGWGWFQRIYGPAGQELGAFGTWPTPDVPIAVIAGTRARGLNPTGWVSHAAGLIRRDEASDGTVLVEETHLPGMIDFATVEASHTFIMDHPDVQRMVLSFLQEGRLRSAP